jgi:hypothetical protein
MGSFRIEDENFGGTLATGNCFSQPWFVDIWAKKLYVSRMIDKDGEISISNPTVEDTIGTY